MATRPNPQAATPQDAASAPEQAKRTRNRLPTPEPEAGFVSLDEIPVVSRDGVWADRIKVLKDNPDKYQLYRGVGASTVGQLRKQHGLDARGRNTRYVDEAGNPTQDKQSGTKVVDMYVCYPSDPEQRKAIKAGRAGVRGRPAAQATA